MNSIWTMLPPWSQRRAARWLSRRLGWIQSASPVVSFTFDDFPRSALYQGGTILREHGFAGTYYTSFGLMGKTIATGEIFTVEDLEEIVRQKHDRLLANGTDKNVEEFFRNGHVRLHNG